MNDTDLPPLPKGGAEDPRVCAIARLYLAILPDLPLEQVQAVFRHVATCADCAAEWRLLTRATDLARQLAELAPPPHVDQTVMAAIAAGGRECPPELVYPTRSQRISRTRRSPWLIGQVAAASAVLLLAFLTVLDFLSGPLTTSERFTLPGNLSWSGYVLYHRETRVGADGVRYHVTCYHDLGTGRMYVETLTTSGLDILVVKDEQTVLGLDLTHHLAQWDINGWDVDDSLFNLARLRSDLEAGHAFYLGRDYFDGQEVYRIRLRNGLVLLLDMRYRPVNALRDVRGPGTGEPLYETLTLLPAAQVPGTLWEIRVPAGFRWGRLPAGP